MCVGLYWCPFFIPDIGNVRVFYSLIHLSGFGFVFLTDSRERESGGGERHQSATLPTRAFFGGFLRVSWQGTQPSAVARWAHTPIHWAAGPGPISFTCPDNQLSTHRFSPLTACFIVHWFLLILPWFLSPAYLGFNLLIFSDNLR